jgi:hypothetical protein
MPIESLTALAAAGGNAVMQAAGTDAWESFRKRVARIFGRGDTEREHAELERLGRTMAVLKEAAEAELPRALERQAGLWEARFEELLEGSDQLTRKQIADELRLLLAEQLFSPVSPTSAGPGGIAAGRDIKIVGGRDSVAAGIINGDVLGTPRKPAPSQG